MRLKDIFFETSQEQATVVIVGGGYGGVLTARLLDDSFNVILIDRKDYYFHNIASLRASVDHEWIKFISAPYDKLLKRGQVLQGEVEEITRTSIKIEGRDDVITFSYLVIATGSSYSFPFKVSITQAEELSQAFENTGSMIEKATKITIVGGGPVGIELAGEIVEKFGHSKAITLIHSGESLLNDHYSPVIRSNLQTILEEENVTLILGEKIIFDNETFQQFQDQLFVVGEKEFYTDRGRKIETDLLFLCVGAKANCKSYQRHFSHVMDPSGRLKVEWTLQVQGCKNIFALGDCSNADLPMAIWLSSQAGVVASNISKLSSPTGYFFLSRYFRFPLETIIVPFGKFKGQGQIVGIPIPGLAVSLLKGRGLFVWKMWGWVNQTPPQDAPVDLECEFDQRDAQRLSKISSSGTIDDGSGGEK